MPYKIVKNYVSSLLTFICFIFVNASFSKPIRFVSASDLTREAVFTGFRVGKDENVN